MTKTAKAKSFFQRVRGAGMRTEACNLPITSESETPNAFGKVDVSRFTYVTREDLIESVSGASAQFEWYRGCVRSSQSI